MRNHKIRLTERETRIYNMDERKEIYIDRERECSETVNDVEQRASSKICITLLGGWWAHPVLSDSSFSIPSWCFSDFEVDVGILLFCETTADAGDSPLWGSGETIALKDIMRQTYNVLLMKEWKSDKCTVESDRMHDCNISSSQHQGGRLKHMKTAWYSVDKVIFVLISR